MNIEKSLGIILVLASSSVAFGATTRNYSGDQCQSSDPVADGNYLGRFSDGCTNLKTGSASSAAACEAKVAATFPVSGNNSDTVDYNNIYLRYNDTSSDWSITCTPAFMNSAGTIYYGSQQSSSAGRGTITWDNTAGKTLPNSGASTANIQMQHIYCTIPSKYDYDAGTGSCSASTLSQVTNYAVDTVGS